MKARSTHKSIGSRAAAYRTMYRRRPWAVPSAAGNGTARHRVRGRSADNALWAQELDLQARELDLQTRQLTVAQKDSRLLFVSQFLAALSVLAALASVIITTVYSRHSARDAASAVRLSAEQAQLTAEESNEAQLSSVISAINIGNAGARADRLGLLTKDVQELVSLPLPTRNAKTNAVNNFQVALTALAFYLHQHDPGTPDDTSPSLGVANSDIQAAMNALATLSQLNRQVRALDGTFIPQITVDYTDLRGANLSGLNLDWIQATFAHDTFIDANLTDANLGGADFSYSNMSCAGLEGASLRNVNLRHTILVYTAVAGTDFTGIKWSGSAVAGLYGQPKAAPPEFMNVADETPYRTHQCVKSDLGRDFKFTAGSGR